MSKTLCLIAARAGSKRLPRKNLLPLCGKPLVAHSVEQAKLAGLTDIAISSDCDEIIKAATEAGATLTIKRPEELATDAASSLDVIRHAITSAGSDYDAIIFLQVTSPLRIPSDIKKALEIFYEKPVGSVISVSKTKCVDVEITNRQAILAEGFGQDRYKFNGSIYVWDITQFMADPKHIYDNTRLMLMPDIRSIDIDYKSDFDIAETIMQKGEYVNGEAESLN